MSATAAMCVISSNVQALEAGVVLNMLSSERVVQLLVVSSAVSICIITLEFLSVLARQDLRMPTTIVAIGEETPPLILNSLFLLFVVAHCFFLYFFGFVPNVKVSLPGRADPCDVFTNAEKYH
jgi:hypothetical protein